MGEERLSATIPSYRTWSQRPALSRCSHVSKSTFDREWRQGEGRRAIPGSGSTRQTQTWRQPWGKITRLMHGAGGQRGAGRRQEADPKRTAGAFLIPV